MFARIIRSRPCRRSSPRCEFHFFDSAVSLEQWLATNHGEDAFSYGWFDNDGNAFEVCVRKVKHGDLTLYVSSEATNTIGSWND